MNGYVTAVKILLQDENVNPAMGDNVSLLSACKNKHSGVISLLLQDQRVSNRRNFLVVICIALACMSIPLC